MKVFHLNFKKKIVLHKKITQRTWRGKDVRQRKVFKKNSPTYILNYLEVIFYSYVVENITWLFVELKRIRFFLFLLKQICINQCINMYLLVYSLYQERNISWNSTHLTWVIWTLICWIHINIRKVYNGFIN